MLPLSSCDMRPQPEFSNTCAKTFMFMLLVCLPPRKQELAPPVGLRADNKHPHLNTLTSTLYHSHDRLKSGVGLNRIKSCDSWLSVLANRKTLNHWCCTEVDLENCRSIPGSPAKMPMACSSRSTPIADNAWTTSRTANAIIL